MSLKRWIAGLLSVLAASLFPLSVLAVEKPADGREILVFAAASMKNVLEEIAGLFGSATGSRVTISFAGSSQLARQIEQGAPADLFISANPQWMERLEQEGLLAPGSPFDLAGNRLVLIAHGRGRSQMPIGPGFDLAAALGDGRLAMALVDAVPAGMYGKAALEKLGLWEQVRENVAQTDNVRAALALVSIGEAKLGIVYETDALSDPEVSVVSVFAGDSHPPIVYPVARMASSTSQAAADFLDFLRSPQAEAAFRSHGFTFLAARTLTE